MNTNYLYDYVTLFERALSFAYKNKYSLDALQRNISYSDTFLSIENNKNDLGPVINDKSLIKSLFPDVDSSLEDVPEYNQCLWAAESYLRIQNASSLTFEAIFFYIPIKAMFDYFPVYHEMDFSQIINRFFELYNSQSVLSLLLRRYGYSVKKVSEMVSIPYDTLQSLKSRRRNITKISVDVALSLSRLFNVRIETITEQKSFDY